MLISIMKIFITLLLLFNITFASKAIEYNQLDNELNKISTKLSLEDKVYLYSLILSTENKIKTIVSTKEKNIESLKKLNSKTILFLKELKHILEYIAKDKPSASLKFKDELKILINSIPNNPYKYRQSIYFQNKNIRDMI